MVRQRRPDSPRDQRPPGRHGPLTRPAQRTVLMLALLLTVDYADRGVLGAMTPTLKGVFRVSNTDIGALSAVFGLVGAVTTVPVGTLVDRVRRIRLLTASAGVWSVAMTVTGAATSFTMLFLARMSLAVVTATVGPSFPSITGDLVPDDDRSRVLGLIEAGQLLGNVVGLGVAALAVGVLSWRWGFWLLVVPGVVLAYSLSRLPEPGRSQRPDRPAAPCGPSGEAGDAAPQANADDGPAPAAAAAAAAADSLLQAARRVLTVRTNVLLILAVSAANYFLSGAGAFAVLFAVEQYRVGNGTADLALLALALAALAGILLGGRLSDRLTASGRKPDRLLLCVGGCGLAAPLWLPALLVRSLPVALPFLILGTGCLAAALPALDAVRLDVVPPQLRGRAEAVRTLARTVAEGGAPLVIGVMSDHLAGGGLPGLRLAMLATLPGLLLAAVLALAARSSYPDDAAAAAA